MRFSVFTLCLFLVLSQAAPLDKLRQQTVRATKMAEDASNAGSASLSFLEKQQEFEMEKETNQAATEAEAVDNLVESEVQDAQQQAEKQSQAQAATQPTTNTQPPTASEPQTVTQTTPDTAAEQTVAIEKTSQQQSSSPSPASPSSASPSSSEKKEDKPMQWEDAVLVEDLTKERAGADAFTKYIGANMKSKKVGAPKAASFLQMGPPVYYYPVHPAFLQQAQRMHARQQQQNKEGRSEAGASATTKGWGDYGTPLYYASQFGSYDGMGDGLDGLNMYGNFGYAPYTSGYNPAYTQAAGGPTAASFPPGAYYNPYSFGGGQYASGWGGGGGAGVPAGFEYGGFQYGGFGAPVPPPMPTDLPLPPYVAP